MLLPCISQKIYPKRLQNCKKKKNYLQQNTLCSVKKFTQALKFYTNAVCDVCVILQVCSVQFCAACILMGDGAIICPPLVLTSLRTRLSSTYQTYSGGKHFTVSAHRADSVYKSRLDFSQTRVLIVQSAA